MFSWLYKLKIICQRQMIPLNVVQFTKFMYFCNRISKKTYDEKDIIRWNARFVDVHVLY